MRTDPGTTGMCRGLQRQNWVVRMREPCTARDGGAGWIPHRRWGRTTGSQGGTRTHATFSGVGVSVVPVPVPVPVPASASAAVGGTRSRGARCKVMCEDGRRCCGLNRRLRACAILAICFLRLRVLKLVDWGRQVNLVGWRMRARSVRGGSGGG